VSLPDGRRARRDKIDQIEEDLVAAKVVADEREPHVNALWLWLTSRRVSNGIGRDFEWTLANPRRSGA